MPDVPGPLTVEEARRRILELCTRHPPERETVPICRAHGRILGEDIVAGSDLPAFANSAMDGFALRGAELPLHGEKRFRVVGTRLAGEFASAEIGAGECLRIMTGAVMPRATDTVVIRERARIEGDAIIVESGETAGANVRRAGEDFQRGDRVAGRGERIGAGHLAVLASLGLTEVKVARRPRLVVLTTGDELVMPGEPRSPAQIYNSNGFSLIALAEMAGADTVAGGSAGPVFRHVRDDEQAIQRALLSAAAKADVILTSGGVSAGDADFMPALIARTGRVHFWKVRMRPGMPFLCGEIGRTLVFCLPGNPVSGIATFLALVQPALAALQASGDVAPPEHPAKLAASIEKRHPRTEFLRARSEVREDASIWATPLARQGSSMLSGVVEANCLIVVPESVNRLEIGATIRIMPLPRGC
jgi:molybdopterin molybdotransferase